MSLDVAANLAPLAAFPLKDATASLQLADGSHLESLLDWTSEVVGNVVHNRLKVTLKTERLDVGGLVVPVIPPAVISMAANFDVQLLDRDQLRSAQIALDFADGTKWNKEALSGRLSARIVNEVKPASAAKAADGYVQTPAQAVMDQPLWKRAEEHTSELQSIMRISYDVFCLKTTNTY